MFSPSVSETATQLIPVSNSFHFNMQTMLSPQPIRVMHKGKRVFFDAAWAGRLCTFLRSSDGSIWGCGMNSSHQLGPVNPEDQVGNCVYLPLRLSAFDLNKKWIQICAGEQHTLALDSDGTVYSMGCTRYGRLGLGEPEPEDDPVVTKLTPVPGLERRVVAISAGDNCSFALDRDGQLWCWGQGTDMLGQGDRDEATDTDIFVPTVCTSEDLGDHQVIRVAAGSHHTLCVVRR